MVQPRSTVQRWARIQRVCRKERIWDYFWDPGIRGNKIPLEQPILVSYRTFEINPLHHLNPRRQWVDNEPPGPYEGHNDVLSSSARGSHLLCAWDYPSLHMAEW
jgi:hypothetical protein